MDLVVPAAEGGQQADAGGPVQQRDRGVAVQPGQLGHRVVPGDFRVAHEAQGVGVDGVAEQVQHRQLVPLGVGERLGEPVAAGRRPATGCGPAPRPPLPPAALPRPAAGPRTPRCPRWW